MGVWGFGSTVRGTEGLKHSERRTSKLKVYFIYCLQRGVQTAVRQVVMQPATTFVLSECLISDDCPPRQTHIALDPLTKTIKCV